MRIAFQVEDRYDFEIVLTFTQRILGEPVEPTYRERRAGGVGAVRTTLHAVAWASWHSEDAGLIVVIDNDDQLPIHEASHVGREADKAQEGCNYCDLVRLLPDLPPRSPLPPLKFAVGVAVQALESWLLFGAQNAKNAKIKREAQPEQIPKEQLKARLFGKTHASRADRLAIAKPIAEKVVLEKLSKACPSFRFFEQAVRKLRN